VSVPKEKKRVKGITTASRVHKKVPKKKGHAENIQQPRTASRKLLKRECLLGNQF
jgi:hypothetical protein